MPIDDTVLPAAAHLTGPHAAAVLAPAVDAAGGQLRAARPCHVQYRPGNDIVVRFSASVSWRGGEPVRETLLAGTSVAGPPPGTMPVTALDGDRELLVGVWRWPFDPVLTALPHVVTPGHVDQLLRGHLVAPLRVEVIAYRPAERVVAKVTDRAGRTAYVKVVEPGRTAGLVERHRRLRAAGIAAAEVIAGDDRHGWFAMDALEGPTLRDRLKGDIPPWPEATAYLTVRDQFAAVDLPDASPVRRRLDDAALHAAMLATVLPEQRARIDRLTDLLAGARDDPALARRTIHGDLHEAQLVVRDAEVVGVLDVDDAGPGDPLDDLAAVLGHLRFRAASAANGAAIARYASTLEDAFAAEVDRRALAQRVAAVLVGLATGPFRIQQAGWRREVRRHLVAAEAVAAGGARVPGG